MKAWRPLSVAALGLVACSEGPRAEPARDSALPDAPTVTAESTATERKLTGHRVAGIRFDPTTIRIGTRVGGMVLDSPPGDSAPAAIVIDRLTIHRGLSDEVNTARFVRALSPRQ